MEVFSPTAFRACFLMAERPHDGRRAMSLRKNFDGEVRNETKRNEGCGLGVSFTSSNQRHEAKVIRVELGLV